MVQVIQMTQKEKMAMYMKLSKKELAKMLINCNVIIESMATQQSPTVSTAQLTSTGEHFDGSTQFTYITR